jgi:hypothetical protein
MKTKHFSLFASSLAIVAALASCSKKDTTITSAPPIPVSNPIKSDTIGSFEKGTLLAGKTYTMNHDVYVKKGDTLLAQPGAIVIVKNNAQFSIQGHLQILGTKDQPIIFDSFAHTPGTWGGFQCDSAQEVTMKWADVKNTGGALVKGGGARPTVKVTRQIPVDIEDSWFRNGQDDALALYAGVLTVLRNTVESSGSNDGEGINIKGGAVGICAYNVVYNQAGTGIKLETSTKITTGETTIDVYNNTCVSNGWRRGNNEPGRGVSVGLGAHGNIYNNIFVNNYHGLEIFTDADVNQTKYGYNLFYATVDSKIDTVNALNLVIPLRPNFYPNTALGVAQSTDIISTAVGNADPKFANYDGLLLVPNGAVNSNNFHLQSGSPAIGKGITTWPGMSSMASVALPSKDLGAYPTDGSGNKH